MQPVRHHPLAALALALACLAPVASAQSGGDPSTGTYLLDHITVRGVRWDFQTNEICGRYVNGDWWVLGPVTITDITPETSYVPEDDWWRDGTMVNPSAVTLWQGLDNTIFDTAPGVGHGYRYNHELNIGDKLPKLVPADSSVVTCVSEPTPGNRPQLRQVEVLTVVSEAPAKNSFRPVYTGNGPRTSPARLPDLDRDKLQGLPTAQPSALSEPVNWNALAATVDGVWYEAPGVARYMKRYSRPSETMPDYGQKVQERLWDAMLPTFYSTYTNASGTTTYSKAQKKDTVVNLVQIGLDRWGMAVQDPATYAGGFQTYGGHWDGGAGHGDGAKLSMVYAAWLLDDAGMMDALEPGVLDSTDPAIAPWQAFQEDDQPFVVVETEPGVANYGLCGYGTAAAPLGVTDWGVSHWWEVRQYGFAVNDDPRWFIEEEIPGCPPNGNGSEYRTCCTSRNWWGQQIISRIIADERGEPEPAFYTQAFHDYLPRYFDELVVVRGIAITDPMVFGTPTQRECWLAWDPLY